MGNSIYRKEDTAEFFPTPAKVRDDLYSMLPKDAHYILDPCCGDGGLELDDDKYDYTLFDLVDRSNGKFSVNIGDFLEQPFCSTPNGEKFDAVIMNPPFGLCEEFIKKSFQFSDDIYMICPFKSVIKAHPYEAVDWKIDWHYACMFEGIRVCLGIVHLHKAPAFGNARDMWAVFNKDRADKEHSFAKIFYETDKAPDKWFIVNRITMTRVERGHQLIQDMDIYAPNDESAFIAIAGNVNVKKGSKIKRRITVFDSYEDAKAFQKKYNDNDEWYRNYMYKYCCQIPKIYQWPLLP